jgi:diadenylate cyclase
MVNRLGQEVSDFVVELGSEGRLIQLQLEELLAGLDRERLLLLRDYLPGLAVNKEAGATVLARLSSRDLLDLQTVARTVGLVDASTPSHSTSPLQLHLNPKGYRLLARVPRLGDGVIEHVVDHFAGLPALLDASVQSLTRVEGIGDVRARAIREGITRVVETVVTEARRR